MFFCLFILVTGTFLLLIYQNMLPLPFFRVTKVMLKLSLLCSWTLACFGGRYLGLNVDNINEDEVLLITCSNIWIMKWIYISVIELFNVFCSFCWLTFQVPVKVYAVWTVEITYFSKWNIITIQTATVCVHTCVHGTEVSGLKKNLKRIIAKVYNIIL